MKKVNSRSLWLALLLGAVFLTPSPSFAQMYVGVYGGATFPHNAEMTVPSFGITIPDVEFEDGAMVGARVGYWFESLPFFGLETELYWAGPKISAQSLTVTAAGASGTIPIQEADFEVLTTGINALLRYPHETFQPYLGVGVGFVTGEFDAVKTSAPVGDIPTGTTFLEGGDDAIALQLIGGARVFVTKNIALFGEYKWITTEFEGENVEIDYNAHHAYGGIEYHFGPGVKKK